MLGRSSALTLVAPVVIGEVLLAPLDPEAATPGVGLEPPDNHWEFAVKQAGLSEEQVGGLLRSSWHRRRI